MKNRTRQMILGFTLVALVGTILLSVSPESNSAQQPMTAVAYGFVLEDGSNQTSTFNVSSTFYDFNASQYEITIDGIDYFFSSFMTVVTPTTTRDGKPIIASTDSVNGNLVVVLQDVAGNRIQGDFQFVTYSP